ncbi:MAG: glycosyltransferase family 39 protein [Kouleothrix sp.]
MGVWPARLVAVLCGAATLLLTYALGRRLFGGGVAALAAWLLIGLRLAYEHDASGVPLLDLARIARYDMAVPPLVLAALLCLVWAEQRGASWRYVLSGALAGLATLAHLYGGFVLPIRARCCCGAAGQAWCAGLRPTCSRWGARWRCCRGRCISPRRRAVRRPDAAEQARWLWEPAFYLQSRCASRRATSGCCSIARAWRCGRAPGSGPRCWGCRSRAGCCSGRQSRAGRWPSAAAVALPLLALQLALLVNLRFYNYIWRCCCRSWRSSWPGWGPGCGARCGAGRAAGGWLGAWGWACCWRSCWPRARSAWRRPAACGGHQRLRGLHPACRRGHPGRRAGAGAAPVLVRRVCARL